MRSTFVSAGLCVVATVGSPSFASGQQSQETVQLPPMVVEGERETEERTYGEKKARQEIRRTPGGVALVGSQEIKESRATALQDVLDFVPGMMIRPRFGNVADESQVSIRGSGLRNNFHLRGLSLLIDGFPINNADGFGDFEALELLAARRL